ncbi:hypothetical protein HDU97_008852 [Phlyctochytrium planicorne]|nr:hypothetical protein HDU97_008852 [Phlyctochytrium planicorne]
MNDSAAAAPPQVKSFQFPKRWIENGHTESDERIQSDESSRLLEAWENARISIWRAFPRDMERAYSLITRENLLIPFMSRRTPLVGIKSTNLNHEEESPSRIRIFNVLAIMAAIATVTLATLSLFRISRKWIVFIMPICAMLYFCTSYYVDVVRRSNKAATPLGTVLTVTELTMRARYRRNMILKHRMAMLKVAKEKVESLLSLNLPNSVITRLRSSGGDFDSLTEEIPSASVIFIEFPSLKDIGSGESLLVEGAGDDIMKGVQVLNTVLKEVEEIVENFQGVELIKSIGNKILLLVDAGDDASNAHLIIALNVILKIFSTLEGKAYQNRESLFIKAGLHVGAVSSAIIGDDKFVYGA